MENNKNKPKIKEVFSKQLKARERRYYFDLKENEKGAQFLTISETQPSNPKFSRMRLLVFSEYIEEFIQIIEEVKKKSEESAGDNSHNNSDDNNHDMQQ